MPGSCSTSSTGSRRLWPAGVWDDEELTSDLALPPTKVEPYGPSDPSEPFDRRPSGPVTEDTNAFEILPIAEPFEAAAPATPLPSSRNLSPYHRASPRCAW